MQLKIITMQYLSKDRSTMKDGMGRQNCRVTVFAVILVDFDKTESEKGSRVKRKALLDILVLDLNSSSYSFLSLVKYNFTRPTEI